MSLQARLRSIAISIVIAISASYGSSQAAKLAWNGELRDGKPIVTIGDTTYTEEQLSKLYVQTFGTDNYTSSECSAKFVGSAPALFEREVNGKKNTGQFSGIPPSLSFNFVVPGPILMDATYAVLTGYLTSEQCFNSALFGLPHPGQCITRQSRGRAAATLEAGKAYKVVCSDSGPTIVGVVKK